MNILVALISVAVGALLGGLIQALVQRYAAFRESKGMAAALRAEITSVVALVEHREYIEHLDEMIGRLQNSTHQPTLEDLFAIRITQDYFTVFNSLCPKIGLLGDLSGRIVRLYVLAKGVIEDFSELRDLRERALAGQVALQREGLLQFTQAVRALLWRILDEAPQLIHDLAAYEARLWWGMFP